MLTQYWQSLSPALRRYYRISMLPCVVFAATAVAHEWISREAGAPVALRGAFAVLPALVMAWMFALYLRFLRDCDELERRIELGALAWSAGITMLGLLAGLFLLDAGLLELPAKQALAGLGVLLFGGYALVRAVLHRRYA
ncbi:hypothetical protein [Lysobacter sp. Root494]|uniref:hypothetical protein n=1 Tax=Lysobacter sp. Root494 TaxID=1736549 RepID=UPI0006FEA21E|nr:hypothetical protein [Lysobacter sp. Root494]KQY49295.1 hypothetical protein ASD14_14595 [Lysobacter sp. Root494]